MRYSQSEKMEIIRLVEESDLPIKRTLDELDVPKSTFYRWYRRYNEYGYDGLPSRPPNANRFWNRIPDHEKEKVVEAALDYPELSPRELAWKITNSEGTFISESSVYRILKSYDRRNGPRTAPANKLSPSERQQLLSVANSPEYRDLSPRQIVPRLADEGRHIASESTFYRILRAENQLAHRECCCPVTHLRPREKKATGPCHVWSWDITYLRSTIRGQFYYLYIIADFLTYLRQRS